MSNMPANTDLNQLVDAGTFKTTTIARDDLLPGRSRTSHSSGVERGLPILADQQVVPAAPERRTPGERRGTGYHAGSRRGHRAGELASRGSPGW